MKKRRGWRLGQRERERERSGWGKATVQHTLHSIPPLLLSLRVTLFPTLSSLTRTYSLPSRPLSSAFLRTTTPQLCSLQSIGPAAANSSPGGGRIAAYWKVTPLLVACILSSGQICAGLAIPYIFIFVHVHHLLYSGVLFHGTVCLILGTPAKYTLTVGKLNQENGYEKKYICSTDIELMPMPRQSLSEIYVKDIQSLHHTTAERSQRRKRNTSNRFCFHLNHPRASA